MSIVLFEKSKDEISISITTQIDANGDLLISGNDSGKLVQELKGDYNYEYKALIKKDDQEELLIKKIEGTNESLHNDESLMKWLKSN